MSEAEMLRATTYEQRVNALDAAESTVLFLLAAILPGFPDDELRQMVDETVDGLANDWDMAAAS
ncbi:hypothetical protein LQL77_06990 [Rhodococcus cerastii]|nr:hypothetical protein [Rhodococcus cerastii]